MKKMMTKKIKNFLPLETPLFYHYNTEYNPTEMACAMTQRQFKHIMIDKEYWRLPDPQSDLIWVDVFDGEDISQGSKSESDIDRNDIPTLDNLPINFKEEAFFEYLAKKIHGSTNPELIKHVKKNVNMLDELELETIK